jgi:signal transduction histidine kinase/ActR/RegA family two-component response regulator
MGRGSMTIMALGRSCLSALQARLGRPVWSPVRAAPADGSADEQLRMVWSHMRIGTLVATAFAALLALHLRGDAVPALLADVWLGVKVGVAALRVAQGRRYDSLGAPGGAQWQHATHVLLALDGAVWGAAGIVLMGAPIPTASLVGAALAGIACVATFGLQVSVRATAAYVVPMLAPTALGLMLRNDDFGWIGGTGLVMLLALQLVTSARSEQRVVEGVRLRLQAQALAHEKDEALRLALRQSAVKTQFLANISHELRTPLHGMLGVARLLHLEAPDAAVARRVELIEASGVHLLTLINDLLDVARVESGRLALRNERFDLVQQVDQVAGVYAVRAGDKGLGVVARFEIERPYGVYGDAARLRQVLHNLLGNAIKFTQRGSIGIVVRPGAGPDLVAIDVSDTGSGIPASEMEQIFEAFRQVGEANAKPLEGAGLGLTIAREIAQAMGGDVQARSQLGRGTTMLFPARLPRAAHSAPSRDEAAATRDRAALASAGAPATAAQRRVLLAEDEDVNALIATAYLERWGVVVERARDGKEAVRHALREMNRPELVLMDCRMPSLDGYAATREIRAQERTLDLSHLPVVALTATAGDAEREVCLAAGMDDFLPKPFSSDELLQMLQRWLEPQDEASATAER